MKKLMIVLFLALFVFTGCEKEPITYDLCEVTLTAEYSGNYFSLSMFDDTEISVTNQEETISYYYSSLTSNPYVVYLQTEKTYVITTYAWYDDLDYYYTSTNLVNITNKDSALNIKANMIKRY